MDRNNIALRIFCALLSREEPKLDLYPELGEKQIRTCFMLAETFRLVAIEKRAGSPLRPPPPADIGGMAKKSL